MNYRHLMLGFGIAFSPIFLVANKQEVAVTITVDDDEEVFGEIGLSQDLLNEENEQAYDNVCDKTEYATPSKPMIWLRTVGSRIVASLITSKAYISDAFSNLKTKIRNLYS